MDYTKMPIEQLFNHIDKLENEIHLLKALEDYLNKRLKNYQSLIKKKDDIITEKNNFILSLHEKLLNNPEDKNETDFFTTII